MCYRKTRKNNSQFTLDLPAYSSLFFIKFITKETQKMDSNYWLSILMAWIATASMLITYLVFRSSTYPLIIVYADPDIKRPSIVNLIIKNIGNGPAHHIDFKSGRAIPSEAFGIETPTAMPKTMKAGPIVNGIPFLAPNQQITLTWGQYGGLYKYFGDEPIEVESIFYSVAKQNFFSKKLSAKSTLDIRMFKNSESSEYGFGPNLVTELKELNHAIKAIGIELKRLTQDRK